MTSRSDPNGTKAVERPAPARQRRGDTLTDIKHQRAAEMLRELRSSAEALSANADRLIARYS